MPLSTLDLILHDRLRDLPIEEHGARELRRTSAGTRPAATGRGHWPPIAAPPTSASTSRGAGGALIASTSSPARPTSRLAGHGNTMSDERATTPRCRPSTPLDALGLNRARRQPAGPALRAPRLARHARRAHWHGHRPYPQQDMVLIGEMAACWHQRRPSSESHFHQGGARAPTLTASIRTHSSSTLDLPRHAFTSTTWSQSPAPSACLVHPPLRPQSAVARCRTWPEQPRRLPVRAPSGWSQLAPRWRGGWRIRHRDRVAAARST